MKAEPVYPEKKYFEDGSFQEIKIWKVRKSKDEPHGLKYSFAYIMNYERVVGYDNAEGKGDHRHFKDNEYPYKFQSLEKLWSDFKRDIERYKEGKYESQESKNSDKN
jgi:hypothetical protein